LTEDTVYYWNGRIPPDSLKVAACFDLDWTLVRPEKSKFPKTFNDNVIMNNRIPMLKQYIGLGYKIVIFSNQKITPRESLQFKVNRMEDVISKFKIEGIPLIVYMATAEDKYRKPNIGMWEEFRKTYTKLESAFYCGDAAGRKDDFSDSDLKFAENIGIKFYTPEELFGS